MNGLYHPLLVAASVAVAIFASYTALDLADSISVARGRARQLWLAGGAVAMGTGIWSMHFIGMLAWQMPGMPIAYDVWLLVLSVAVAVAASGLALAAVARQELATRTTVGAGLALGAAIAGMHYLGIWAMRMPARIEWSPLLVAASVGVAVGASFLALHLAFRQRTVGVSRWRARAGGAVVLGAAIAGMHYTAMAAAHFVPSGESLPVHGTVVLASSGLAVATAGTTLVVLLIAVAGSMASRELARRVSGSEAELRHRTAAILESITDGFFALDHQWRFTYVNAEAERLLARSRRELLGRSVWETFSDVVGTQFEREYRRAVAQQRTVSFEAFYPGLDAWYEVRAYPAPEGLSVYFQDVSRRKRAEAELAAAEAHYRRLVETLPYAIFAMDAGGRFTELNPATEAITGRTPEELLGRHWGEVVSPGALIPLPGAGHDTPADGREVAEYEVRIPRADGEPRLVHIRSTPVREAGDRISALAIVRDITGERAQQEQVRLLSHVLDHLEEAVSVSELESGRPVYRNVAWAHLLGCDPERRYEYTLDAFLPDAEARAQLEEIRRSLAAVGRWSGRVRWRRMDDGRLMPLNLIVGTGAGEDGRVLSVAIHQDATDQIDRERRLRRAERLAGLGTLVGGVAHEINNPLSAILNFAQLLLERPRPDDEREDLEIIQHEARRMAQIVANLRQVARHTQAAETARGPADLNEVARHVLRVRQYATGTHDIQVRAELSEALPLVWANRGELEQVVLNLVVNAEQALTSRESVDRVLTLRTLPSQLGATLQVGDNGPGIVAEHLDRIFDPFFTTKPPGQGVGLGLSLVHGIVEEHGGSLRVESEPGGGAMFTVDLPLAREPAPTRPATASDTPGAPRPLRILLVDDEPSLRLTIARYLRRRGHQVDEAGDGLAALARVEQQEDSGYDVIVSDLRMPRLDGEGLLRRLRARGDGLDERVLFLTGDPSAQTRRFLETAGVPVMHKPLSLIELAEQIERRAGVAPVPG